MNFEDQTKNNIRQLENIYFLTCLTLIQDHLGEWQKKYHSQDQLYKLEELEEFEELEELEEDESRRDFFFPEKKEQSAITNVISAFDSEIKRLEEKLGKITCCKQAMMQELLTGKVRLV